MPEPVVAIVGAGWSVSGCSVLHWRLRRPRMLIGDEPVLPTSVHALQIVSGASSGVDDRG
jgi:hypothetical protein